MHVARVLTQLLKATEAYQLSNTKKRHSSYWESNANTRQHLVCNSSPVPDLQIPLFGRIYQDRS